MDPGTVSRTATMHPLIVRLFDDHDCAQIDDGNIDAFVQPRGHALLVFADDPLRSRETQDLAVIVPELARAFPGRFRLGVLLPPAARQMQARYGFRRWPALVMLRDGAYVGAVDGLRAWDEYLEETRRLLTAEPMRPPTIGVAVNATGTDSTDCHS